MTLKQMDTTEMSVIENNTKLINTRVRKGVFFRFQRVNTESFSVRDSRIVTLNLNVFYYCQNIPFSNPLIFVLNPGLLTNKKEEYISSMCFYVCVFIIKISATLPSY